MIELFYEDGWRVEDGDIISWVSWDNDDNKEWTFYGVVKNNKVYYLLGGMDKGNGMLREVAPFEIISDLGECDGNPSVVKVGCTKDLVTPLSNILQELETNG